MFECSEQLLFSCVSSKVSICNYVACHMSHVMSNAYVDPWNMPNNFCIHVYAQKSLIISEIGNEYFFTSASSREFRGHRAGSQLKIRPHSHCSSPNIVYVWVVLLHKTLLCNESRYYNSSGNQMLGIKCTINLH